jgi:FkbM family methyltransferase
LLPPMISYAQNAEDVVLRRAFHDVASGFYVDVGACVPVDDSVTHHFYESGWSGVNVEPDPGFHRELVEARPRDTNLAVAVGAAAGEVSFFPTQVRGHGTLDPSIAAERAGESPEQVVVPQVTLQEVLDAHAPPAGVDFLKVDVEGWEAEVLAGHDFASVRPRVVVVEAVDAAGRPVHEDWEPGLLSHGYRLALFDGLNRFYVAEEEADRLLPRLQAPANVLDAFRAHREVRAQQALQDALEDAQRHARDLEGAVDAVRQEVAAVRERLDASTQELRTAREDAAGLSARLSSTESELASCARARERSEALLRESLAEADLLRADVAALTASTSWRLTRPVRDASRLLKVVRPGRRG